MRTRVRDESGFALITVMMLLFAMLAVGIALTSRADSQSRESAHERTRESSFNLAEAALNAQALQLSRSWPATLGSAISSCDPSATGAGCPQANAIGGGYTTQDYASACPTSSTTPLWQTQIRDNITGEKYWRTAVNSQPAYDANGDGYVWGRATASAQCDKVSVVSLIGRASIPMDFPSSALTANWFQTSNQGRKVIVDTLGAYAQPPSIRPTSPAAQPSPITVRCSGVTSAQCMNYPAGKGQIQPPAIQQAPTSSTSAIGLAQLQALERQAMAAGTYYATGTCPTASQLSSVNGAPVVVAGPCNISVTSNVVINSSTNPGVLVIENGTFTLGGTSMFYGLLYMVNKQGSTGSVVTVQGNATVQGSITVDGAGGVTLGSSKTNLIFDARAPTLLRGDSGATLAKNTFRVLPPSTP